MVLQVHKPKIGQKHPDDVVIVCAVRTAITKAYRGGFKDTKPERLLTEVLKAVIDRTKLEPALVDDVVVGTVCSPGAGAGLSRMAVLSAGLPERCSVMSVNRQCSSGLQAVCTIASEISNGMIDIGIGAGMESMTHYYNTKENPLLPTRIDQNFMEDGPDCIAECLIPMGITSDNVARDFGVTRYRQDLLSVRSHRNAAYAQKSGHFTKEIVPVAVDFVEKDGSVTKKIISEDDGIRTGTTLETLAKLKAVFGDDGTTTAGNASQISDGAAAVLLMKRKTAIELGLPIMGKYIANAVVGVPPRVMGIGPAFAIPAAAKKANIKISDIDILELNEAFASQASYCIEKIQIDASKVNPSGGAIALGHPLGCTGARQIATLMHALKRQSKHIGAVSMCMGTGMGMCAIFESE
ncbi:3-ketoacyl-CoA thiolase B, peroxisomal [Zancudomyces culisetae]|uniref:3-ketoacyl-CoA thiolase B, peroxisomal n=1 Tax=Zancudomyces culisetae TaxID=1213189 RepID=A0A1R1PTS7_ZANCU|nr:3-ketoacyl-CoA thiolase B, peroxisomal [Zancudomyces culisetae]|eukprot:OMH84351.1 3-ketoacyl-CoA thiolase B, peroxisomal [Zancudomyces culisetae]